MKEDYLNYTKVKPASVVEKFYSQTQVCSSPWSSDGNFLRHGGQRVCPCLLLGSAVNEALAKAEAKRVQVELAPVTQQLVLVVPEGQTRVGLLQQQQQLSSSSPPELNRTCRTSDC